MRISIIAGTIAAVVATAALAQTAPDIAGDWAKTTFGPARFDVAERSEQDRTVREVSGVYMDGKGRLKGEQKGRNVSGYWTEIGGGEQCPTARDGSRNWGRFNFTFDPDGQSFAGKWQYCEAAPDQDWTGARSG